MENVLLDKNQPQKQLDEIYIHLTCTLVNLFDCNSNLLEYNDFQCKRETYFVVSLLYNMGNDLDLNLNLCVFV